ncbi:hypothetical protein JRQ81_016052 [Phrynocephalus forsythii]|uniref:Uncharacterized protein n=1 Tax=Phrynocephalus forsythii TaxID=171643 RepID=A0A9Q0XV42_9SAUR|nr:hypothetical protein JRQ81_016052 [Phrynocephalus forsythii]
MEIEHRMGCWWFENKTTLKGMEEDYDDAKIEEEIELELSQISFSSFEIDDPNSDVSLEASSDSEPI